MKPSDSNATFWINLLLDDAAGEYAWKAIMIHRVLVERGFVLWQDAGCRYTTAQSLVQSLDHISQHGFASRATSGSIKDWTFPAQLQFLRASTVDLSQSNCDGSSIGFTLKRSKIHPCSPEQKCVGKTIYYACSTNPHFFSQSVQITICNYKHLMVYYWGSNLLQLQHECLLCTSENVA